MSKQANPALIGAFVIGAVTLLILGLMFFGGQEFLASKKRYILYFAESVNGLNIGSPVKIRGVPVGKVVEIRVQYDSKTNTLLTPVIVEVNPDIIHISTDAEGRWRKGDIQQAIKKGLRARLDLQSLVTGQLFVAVDFHPDTPVNLVRLDREYEEIPVIPSSQTEIRNTIEELVRQVRELPLKEIFTKLNATLSHIDEVVSQPELKRGVQRIDKVLANLEILTANLDQELDEVTTQLDQTLTVSRQLLGRMDDTLPPLVEQTRHTMMRAEKTLKGIEETLGPDTDLAYEAQKALEEVQRAARDLRILMEMVQTRPEMLLRGKR